MSASIFLMLFFFNKERKTSKISLCLCMLFSFAAIKSKKKINNLYRYFIIFVFNRQSSLKTKTKRRKILMDCSRLRCNIAHFYCRCFFFLLVDCLQILMIIPIQKILISFIQVSTFTHSNIPHTHTQVLRIVNILRKKMKSNDTFRTYDYLILLKLN